MPVARRSRKIDAPPDRVWAVIGDPHHMPRWWPGVERMEGVERDRFTQVHKTRKGRPVRMDFHVLQSEPPGPSGDPPGHCLWEQEIEGTPFARVLAEAITEILLEQADGGTRITLALSQKLRGYSRTGAFMLRRATRGKLEEALDGLERIVTGP